MYLSPDSPIRRSLLERAGLLTDDPEPAFDDLTTLVRDTLGVPSALVSVTAESRQLFRSFRGTGDAARDPGVGRNGDRCGQHADPGADEVFIEIDGGLLAEPLAVRDSRGDDRFDRQPLFREHEAVAFASWPVAVGGVTLGALCAIDTAPREWTDHELNVLRLLALMAAREAEWRLRVSSLEQASLGRDAYIAGVGHELRNALNTATLSAALLEAGDDEQAEDLDTLRRSLEATGPILRDLTTRAWLTPDQLVLDPDHADLARLGREAVADARAAAEAAGITLVGEGDETLPVEVDVGRLRQVLANLLTNAVKFTPAGGRVTVGWGCADGEPALWVRDTGVGFAPERAAALFRPFAQAGNEVEGREPGLGLGLAISRSIVESHGGSLTALSEGVGRGSTFRLTLPREIPADGVRPGSVRGNAPGRPQPTM